MWYKFSHNPSLSKTIRNSEDCFPTSLDDISIDLISLIWLIWFICDPSICWDTPRSRQFRAASGSNTSIAVGALWAVDRECGHQQRDATAIFLRQWRQWKQAGGEDLALQLCLVQTHGCRGDEPMTKLMRTFHPWGSVQSCPFLGSSMMFHVLP